MHFYSIGNVCIRVEIDNHKLSVILVENGIDHGLIRLSVSMYPNIRLHYKGNVISFKYHYEWENKFQLCFYAEEDLLSFREAFGKLCAKNFNSCKVFLRKMNDLTGELKMSLLDNDAIGKRIKTLTEFKKEYFKMIHEGID
ncbi:hypothetical protein COBT_002393 [Conglomerata obtusa]